MHRNIKWEKIISSPTPAETGKSPPRPERVPAETGKSPLAYTYTLREGRVGRKKEAAAQRLLAHVVALPQVHHARGRAK